MSNFFVVTEKSSCAIERLVVAGSPLRKDRKKLIPNKKPILGLYPIAGSTVTVEVFLVVSFLGLG